MKRARNDAGFVALLTAILLSGLAVVCFGGLPGPQGAGGGSSVTLPGSSTDTAFARYSGTGGATLQNSQTTEDSSGNVTVAGDLAVLGADVTLGTSGLTVRLSGGDGAGILRLQDEANTADAITRYYAASGGAYADFGYSTTHSGLSTASNVVFQSPGQLVHHNGNVREMGRQVALANSTATGVFTFDVASGALGVGGVADVTVIARNATDFQVRTITIRYSAVNKAGSITADVQKDATETVSVSTGTLTATADYTTGSGTVTVRITATSSLTPTGLYARFHVRHNSAQAITGL